MRAQPRNEVAAKARVHPAADRPEFVRSVQQLWQLGRTMREIAGDLGVTLSRVRKTIERDRASFGHRQVHRRTVEPEPVVTDDVPAPDFRVPAEYAPGLDDLFSGPTPPARGGPVTLMELTLRTCRWPLGQGHGAASLYCGRDTFGLGSYCGACRKRSVARECEVAG